MEGAKYLAKDPGTRTDQHRRVESLCPRGRAWGLILKEAAGLVDMPTNTWKRARKPRFAALTKQQLRWLSVVIGIYKSLEVQVSDPPARSCFC